MEEERIVSARENPRNLGEFSNGISNKAMPVEAAVQKGPPTIVDRFKAMLRDREEEIRVSVDDEVPPPSTEEIVALYELVLAELTFNSKPIITDLTIIAGEQREHGDGIADAICARIVEVPVEQKLSSLYLLDSIVKNIGHEYVRYFSSRLPEVFCEAYWQVHSNLHPAMRHLFGTWLTVFPPFVLRKIEAQLRFSPSINHQSSAGPTSLSAAESPRPSHGIHVNPKYLEARRQFEHSTVDTNNQHARGASSTLNIFGQKSAIGYDDYDSESAEVMSSQVGAQRLSSSGHAGRIFTLGAEKLLPSSASRLAKSSTLKIEQGRSLSPSGDEFAVNDSPRVVDRTSPSHFGVEHGLGKMPGREDSSERPRNQWANGTNRRLEPATAYHNGAELQGPRALIDAYGNDERIQNPNNKPTKIWQNTEEEEFDWEDMSPTLVNHRQSNDLLSPSIPPLESFGIRHGYGRHTAATLDTDIRRSNLSCQAQNAVVNDSPIVLAHALPTLGRGAGSKFMSLRGMTAQLQGSCYPRQALNFPHNLAQSSQHLRNSGSSARNLQMLPSSIGEQKLIDSFSDADAQCRGSSAVASRMRVVSIDSWKPEVLSASIPPSTGAFSAVNIKKSHPLPMLAPLPLHKLSNTQFDLMNTDNAVVSQDLNKSFFPKHQFNSIKNKALSSVELPAIPNKQAGPFPLNAAQQPEQITSYETQLLLSQEARQNLVTPTAVPAVVSMPSLVPPLAHGYSIQGYNTAHGNVLLNPISGMHPSLPNLNAPSSSMHLLGGGLPPLPPGPHTAPTQLLPISHVAPNSQSGSGFSGLIGSLMAHGLISLTNQAPVQDSVGVEFNPDILKVRHESGITALYSDLPRQCTTCGLRFKCQEEHRSHMDWHVTKNRISKNRKQKPSRKWFVSVNMWLTGAEALGADAVPGFLPAEGAVEKKDDEDLAVPADEDQNVCALCGEPFDDFYSDEAEEWMYKGAVYLNATNGSTAGMDRSELGPIVHAKCRSESSVVSPEDFGQDEGEYTEEGSQRKRLRS